MLGALAVAVGLLLSPGAKADPSEPYFGQNYDCSPALTDAQALDLTGTKMSVVESVRIRGGEFMCSWSLASKSPRRAFTVAVEVHNLFVKAYRARFARSICDPKTPLPGTKAWRDQLCEAAEDFVYVKSPLAAFDAYSTLVRRMIPDASKQRFDEEGVRGYYISGTAGVASSTLGVALTMLPRDWKVVGASCLNMMGLKVDRKCSIKVLATLLRNSRLGGTEDGVLSPVKKGGKAK